MPAHNGDGCYIRVSPTLPHRSFFTFTWTGYVEATAHAIVANVGATRAGRVRPATAPWTWAPAWAPIREYAAPEACACAPRVSARSHSKGPPVSTVPTNPYWPAGPTNPYWPAGPTNPYWPAGKTCPSGQLCY